MLCMIGVHFSELNVTLSLCFLNYYLILILMLNAQGPAHSKCPYSQQTDIPTSPHDLRLFLILHSSKCHAVSLHLM